MEKESLAVIAVVALVAVVGILAMQNQDVSGATGNAVLRNITPQQLCRQQTCRTYSVEQFHPVRLHNSQILNVTNARNTSRCLQNSTHGYDESCSITLSGTPYELRLHTPLRTSRCTLFLYDARFSFYTGHYECDMLACCS